MALCLVKSCIYGECEKYILSERDGDKEECDRESGGRNRGKQGSDSKWRNSRQSHSVYCDLWHEMELAVECVYCSDRDNIIFCHAAQTGVNQEPPLCNSGWQERRGFFCPIPGTKQTTLLTSIANTTHITTISSDISMSKYSLTTLIHFFYYASFLSDQSMVNYPLPPYKKRCWLHDIAPRQEQTPGY